MAQSTNTATFVAEPSEPAMEKTTTHLEADSGTLSQFSMSSHDLEKGPTRPEPRTNHELELMRSVTRQDIYTVQSAAQAPALDVANDSDPKIVTWDGPDDPERPMNMAQWRKWAIVSSTGLMTFCVSFGSSVFSSTVFVTAEQFRVSSEVMLLGLSLYVVGFALGPLVWGPISEVYGRSRPLFIGMIGFIIFQIPFGVARNLETIFLARFLAGAFGAAPLAIVGGLFVDFLPPAQLGLATSVFAGAVMAGPAVGPVVGSFITYSYLGWRWTAWITMIMATLFTAICFLVLPETFEPTLLTWRAQRLRVETKDWSLHAKAEEHSLSFANLVQKYLSKPLVIITKEPILIILTSYISLVYGILYLTFEAFPISFAFDREWTPQLASLPFLSILIGTVIAVISVAVFTKTWYAAALAKAGKPIPEHRIPIMATGSIILPIGLFWFAWTSHPSTPWPAQVVAGVFIGAGIVFIFQGAIVYMVDTYLLNANSALAVNTFVRSLVGAAFPMFASYMYRALGVDWATSVLGFVCVALIPFPWILWVYGARIRAMSKFAFVL